MTVGDGGVCVVPRDSVGSVEMSSVSLSKVKLSLCWS